MRISKKLMEEKIPVTHVKSNTERQEYYYYWAGSRISHILRNPFYKGAHLVFRTHQKGVRSNTYNIIPREEWEIIKNCHKAILSPEEGDKVQELIDCRPTIQGNSCPHYNIFSWTYLLCHLRKVHAGAVRKGGTNEQKSLYR